MTNVGTFFDIGGYNICCLNNTELEKVGVGVITAFDIIKDSKELFKVGSTFIVKVGGTTYNSVDDFSTDKKISIKGKRV